jgi:hypothetical protein
VVSIDPLEHLAPTLAKASEERWITGEGHSSQAVPIGGIKHRKT